MEDLLGLSAGELLWYQMMCRAVVVFVIALIFVRLAGMRSFGNHSAFDIVLNITIGAILSRCITGHYPFFPCLGAAAALSLCHRLTAFFVSRSDFFRRLTEGDPIELYANGVKHEKKIQAHSVSDNDIMRTLHEENIDDLAKVKSIWYETDGKISIVKKPSE